MKLDFYHLNLLHALIIILLLFKKKYQPLICTQLDKKISSKNNKTIFYKPRIDIKGSIVCHLGEIHLKNKAKGEIIDDLFIK